MKVFIDSSILIEFEKGTKTDLLTTLIVEDYQLYINSIVVSEYLYKLLAILAGKSPMALNESKGIKTTLDKHQTKDFLVNFDYLPIPESAILLSIDLMKKYNLLPNDAQILATCKLYNIAILASFDSDFAIACNAENITLISKTEQLF